MQFQKPAAAGDGLRRAARRLPRSGAARPPVAASAREPPEARHLVIVDQRRLIADALAAWLASRRNFSVVTCSLEDASASAITALGADLVIVGAGDAPGQAVRFAEGLRATAPELRILLIADAQDPELIDCVLNLGIAGLVLTTVSADDLAVTLDDVLRGNTALPPGWRVTLNDALRDPVAGLSVRQQEVLSLLAQGFSYDDIAARLVISLNTVKFHVHTIYLRLGVSNRVAAINRMKSAKPPSHG